MNYKNVKFGEIEAFNVVIEIPQGSQKKIEYDEELDDFKLNFTFWGDCKFPDNYGFVPETKAGDGDTLDVIVLNPKPLETGTVVVCRAVGIMETLDRGEVDNKLVAIPVGCKEYEKIQDIKDLPAGFEEKYREFYRLVAIQKKKIIEIKGVFGKEKAIEELNKSRI